MPRSPLSVTGAQGPGEPRSGERYTEQQLVEILSRAAERQEGLVAEADGRFSLAEIQQIASEVGIAPAHVATAAAELAGAPPQPTSGALGAPTAFRFERWIEGEVSTTTIGELFDIAQRDTGLQGTVSEALDTVEWRGKGEISSTVVTVTRRQGRTKIAVALRQSDAAALTVTGGSIAGILGTMLIAAPLMGAVADAGALATAAAAVVSLGWAGGASWLATRAVWRRLARRWPPRAHGLGAQLVAAAQRQVALPRRDSE